MISVCCFKWRPPPQGYRSTFTGEHVNTLRRMVARHYRKPHRFICITDDPTGLDSAVEYVPLWSDHAKLRNPMGAHQPSCYRRLKMFSPEIEEVVGKRFVVLDLDAVIVRDLAPLFDRKEDFIIWGDTHPKTFYNGSMWMMTAGVRRYVWEKFNPATSPQFSKAHGHFGSDQGWISAMLGPGEATWGKRDGVYSYRVHVAPKGELPSNARVVFFHGKHDPWDPQCQRVPWIKENWR